jgi:ABC-2 type transport system permease protein
MEVDRIMIIDIALFEIRRLFSGPLAWIILAITQLLMALLFYNLLSAYITQPALFNGQGLTETVVAGYYQSSGIVFVFLTPFLTMRLISEERRNGTIQLLFSSPVSITELILGKFLAVALFMFSLLALISLMPASLSLGTNLDSGHFTASVIGLVMLLAALTAIGLFISSLFRSPTLAAIFTFALLILWWTAHTAGADSNEIIYNIFNHLSLSRHFITFTRGIFNTADFCFFFILCLTFNLLSIWRLDSMRTHHW